MPPHEEDSLFRDPGPDPPGKKAQEKLQKEYDRLEGMTEYEKNIPTLSIVTFMKPDGGLWPVR